jgi:hypothetical protein
MSARTLPIFPHERGFKDEIYSIPTVKAIFYNLQIEVKIDSGVMSCIQNTRIPEGKMLNL